MCNNTFKVRVHCCPLPRKPQAHAFSDVNVGCSSNCFAERLVAFAAVEGIFFSGRYSPDALAHVSHPLCSCPMKCADHHGMNIACSQQNLIRAVAAMQLL